MHTSPDATLNRTPTKTLPELWMLWSDGIGWIDAEDLEGSPKLAYLTEADADAGAGYHCEPVNVLAARRR